MESVTGEKNGKSFVLFSGEALEALKELPSDSVDSLVTDPPAGIEFMGKEWDSPLNMNPSGPQSENWAGGRENPFARGMTPRYTGKFGMRNVEMRAAFIANLTPIFREALRVLKPGAYGLVWSLPRTQYWTATALEDAGFELRGSGIHLFSQGFPKSLDVSKAIDKAAGAPATPAAKQWYGFGTALAPSHEEWILVRKPLIGTVVANVLEHGTGALNIDASRIGYTSEADKASATPQGRVTAGVRVALPGIEGDERHEFARPEQKGRFPKDTLLSHSPECVVVGETVVAGDTRDTGEPLGGARPGGFGDVGSEPGTTTPVGRVYGASTQQVWACPPHCAVRQLDDSVGSRKSGAMKAGTKRKNRGGYTGPTPEEANRVEILPSEGYVSRFFYTGKVPPRERLLPDGTKSAHPTQKSVELMEYLVRLITPPGGCILDPFLGSGTTGVAALQLGFEFIGIERDEQYLAWAWQRISGGV